MVCDFTVRRAFGSGRYTLFELFSGGSDRRLYTCLITDDKGLANTVDDVNLVLFEI